MSCDHGVSPSMEHICRPELLPTVVDPALFLEQALMERASELGELEKARDEEFLLQVVAKVNSFQAQKQAEHRFGPAIRTAQAEYEIALARLRRG